MVLTSFSNVLSVFPLGPISKPTKLMSGCSSWGIITLSFTLVTGGLQTNKTTMWHVGKNKTIKRQAGGNLIWPLYRKEIRKQTRWGFSPTKYVQYLIFPWKKKKKKKKHTKPLSCWINEDAMPTSKCQPIRYLDLDCWHKFINWMANSADPVQLASGSGSTQFAKAEYIRVQ